VVVHLAGSLAVTARIAVAGQPNRILLNRSGDRLFVALDNSDTVASIDTNSGKIVDAIGVTAPTALLPGRNLPRGANPNSLALSPDERTLYVTDGGTNAVAVVSVGGPDGGQVSGLIPTGWYPSSVSVSSDGRTLYVVNGKSVHGPNPGNCRGDARAPKIPDCAKVPYNYVLTMEKASLWSAPVPQGAELEALTKRVAENNHFATVRASLNDPLMEQLKQRIHHVIYIIKENRTYDQVLGDLEKGDGDPSLAEFPEPLTPNHHALARNFVTLDNFLDSGEVSGMGWNWSTAARATDYTEKTIPPNYAGRGFEYDVEGTNRDVNVGIGQLPERVKAQPLLRLGSRGSGDPNLLPGTADIAAPDSESGEAGAGYIWDEALRAGLTVRNYGAFCDLTRYENRKTNPGYIAISKTPFTDKIEQAVPAKMALMDKTDLYFRSFDQNNADFYLYREWEREFDQFAVNGQFPNLSVVRLAHDHFGAFGTALYGINTPALQISDNDYAVGLLAAKISASPYAGDTLIFVIEDDAQDGPDHVDAHRSIAYVVGPYVKQGAVVSQRYTTVNMVRTIEAILGMRPSSLYSAATGPMTEVFDLNQSNWSYEAAVPELLRSSELPLPARAAGDAPPGAAKALADARSRHDAAWWQKKLGGMDYDEEDKLDTPRFNRVLWSGMMGKHPYPGHRSGKNLRENRELMLNTARKP
jgi:DNA-binding beta-propeller fold protein YncE